MTVAHLLHEQPSAECRSGGDLRVHEGECGRRVRAERGARVEPEPAEPQQAGSHEDERQVVRTGRVLLEADASSEDDRQGQARGARVDVDRGPTGERRERRASRHR